MNKLTIKRHFVQSEFLKSSTIPKDYILTPLQEIKISWWIDILSPIRDLLGFPITITNSLRVGNGTSQHFFKGGGAVDIRPTHKNNSIQFLELGLILAATPKISRVCYYPPSERAEYGIFHCDCKGTEKQLFINDGEEINWVLVEASDFISRLEWHSKDLKEVK